MTLLVVLGKSGRVDHVEDFKTSGLASQAASEYAGKGVVCRVVPDELREDVNYLMSQIQEQRDHGFVEERGVIPNGHGKTEGARGFGRMIYPAFGGILGESGLAQNDAPRSAVVDKEHLDSKEEPDSVNRTRAPLISHDDLIVRRH